MMMNELLLDSFRQIEELKPGIKCYAKFINNNTYDWVQIAVDDYDFYMNDPDFKKLKNKIHDDFKEKFNIKIVFVYEKSPENLWEDFKKRLNENIKNKVNHIPDITKNKKGNYIPDGTKILRHESK